MGAQLVAQVYALGWPKRVSYRACNVLCLMAITAMDQPNSRVEAALYFGGRDHLSMAIHDAASPDAIHKSIKLAVGELVAAGAIERVGPAGGKGHNQVYRLTLDRRPGG